jgi:DNA-binding IclR family transcriptional regulator
MTESRDDFAAADSDSSAQSKNEVGSLQRGLAILHCILEAERPLTAAEVAESVSLNASTTHRLLQALVQSGYLLRDEARRYLPCPRTLIPMDPYHAINIFRRAIFEELRALKASTGLTVTQLLYIGNRRLVLETIQGDEAFSLYSSTEVTAPLHATISGKLLLSGLSSDEQLRALGPEPYPSYGENTITTTARMKEELGKVRAEGYAVAIDELLPGLSAVGSAVMGPRGRPLGALIMFGPTKRFSPTELPGLVSRVKHTTELFSLASPIRALARFLGK